VTHNDGALAVMRCTAILQNNPNILSNADQSHLAKMMKTGLCSLLTEIMGPKSFHKSWLKKQLVSTLIIGLVKMENLLARENIIRQITTEKQTYKKRPISNSSVTTKNGRFLQQMAVTVSISEYCLFHQVYNRPLS
jgi:hypothetical protein